MRTRRGQALVELALGMFTLTLVVTALCGFAVFIARSLRTQNTTRSGAEEPGGAVETGIYFGTKTIERMEVREHVNMPSLTIMQ